MAKFIHAVKKLKATGAEVTIYERESLPDLDGTRRTLRNATARMNGERIRFIDQDGQAICINVARDGDEDDLMTDYHAGVWADNITQAIAIAGW